ncbi:MAG: phosphoribosylglycinamide formyltransferase [Endomicrobia bacterium]|nr:phosphoribosylglycinamide formyltransferase [Endomicrobiia bacterium]
MKKIAVLVSGGGSNMQAIIDSSKNGVLRGLAEVVLVVSNKCGAYALERAVKENIKSVCIERKKFKDDFSYNDAILKELKNSHADIVCLAGYMRIVGTNIINAYHNRVLNIHPALLPKYGGKGMYGHFVHQAVLDGREKQSGATVHFADDNYDTGKMIMQKEVPVFKDDTQESLAKRVLETEHKIYPLAIKKVIEKGR